MTDLKRYLLTAHRDAQVRYTHGDRHVVREEESVVEWPLTRAQIVRRLGELDFETATKDRYDAGWDDIEIFELPPAEYEGEDPDEYSYRLRDNAESVREEARAGVAARLAEWSEKRRLEQEAKQREAQRLADAARAAQAEAEQAKLRELVAKYPDSTMRALGFKS